MFGKVVFWILIINGIFDLFSAADMLTVDYWKFHSHMFSSGQVKEPIAFWLLTYGFIRFIAGVEGIKSHLSSNPHLEPLLFLAAITYWLESVFYVNRNPIVSFLSAIGVVVIIILLYTEDITWIQQLSR
jgi:hypothetical protein